MTNIKKDNTGRAKIIAQVSDWLKLLSLIVLSLEIILTIILFNTDKADPLRTITVISMFGLILIIVLGFYFEKYLNNKQYREDNNAVIDVKEKNKNDIEVCKPLLSNHTIIGNGYINDIEEKHNFINICNYCHNDSANTIYIGSPYLRYWFETEDNCRAKRFLEETKKCCVSVILYTPIKNYNEKLNNQEIVKNQIIEVSKLYSDRFKYAFVEMNSSISYIIYDFDFQGNIWQRALIGLQNTKYDKRPFIEYTFPKGNQVPIINTIICDHNKILKI